MADVYVTAVYRVDESHSARHIHNAGLNDNIYVEVANLGKWDAAVPRTGEAKIVPYINGVAIRGVYPISVDTHNNLLVFCLRRLTDEPRDNRAAWTMLLRRPRFNEHFRKVEFTVGTENGEKVLSIRPTSDEDTKFELVELVPWFGALAAVMITLLICLTTLALRSDMLRDKVAVQLLPGQRLPFSLARSQMAFWSMLILMSYIAIWAITGDLGTIPDAIVGLMGISAATGVAAIAVDASASTTKTRPSWQRAPEDIRKDLATKQDELLKLVQPSEQSSVRVAVESSCAAPGNRTSWTELQELARSAVNRTDYLARAKEVEELAVALDAQSPRSHGFLLDIVSDDQGVVFHRFQMAAWTVMLGFVFVAQVYNTLSMPEFNATLLGLMGLSSGTYLGMKFPERR